MNKNTSSSNSTEPDKFLDAVWKGKLELVRQCLQENPALINATDVKGLSALNWAVKKKNNTDMVKLLLEHHAPIDIGEKPNALAFARSIKNLEAAELIEAYLKRQVASSPVSTLSITHPPVLFPENGIVRVYNAFPRRYQRGLHDMLADLPRIAGMGFNAVWINPIQLTGLAEAKNRHVGSLYATGSDVAFNPAFFPGLANHDEHERLLREYTRTARTLGLIPMFDLVLNHVGLNTLLAEQYKAYLGPRHHRWPDVLPFLYAQGNNREEIFNKLWKPFIERYIGNYGFGGVRVDAIVNVDIQIQQKVYEYVEQCCQKFHKTRAIILGELMDKDPAGKIDLLKDVGFSHIFVCGALYRNFIKEPVLDDDWLLKQAKELQRIVWHIPRHTSWNTLVMQEERSRGLCGIGGATGFVGNHDVATLKGMTIFQAEARVEKGDQEITKITFNGKVYTRQKYGDKVENKARASLKWMTFQDFAPFARDYTFAMMEKILRVTMVCNGGWYLLAGDEYGLPHTPHVFEDYKESCFFPQEEHRWVIPTNLMDYIRCINLILADLPKTCLGDSAQYVYLSDLSPVVIRFSGSKVEKPCLICCLNASRASEVVMEEIQSKLTLKPDEMIIYLIDQGQVFRRVPNDKFLRMERSQLVTTLPSTGSLLLLPPSSVQTGEGYAAAAARSSSVQATSGMVRESSASSTQYKPALKAGATLDSSVEPRTEGALSSTLFTSLEGSSPAPTAKLPLASSVKQPSAKPSATPAKPPGK